MNSLSLKTEEEYSQNVAVRATQKRRVGIWSGLVVVTLVLAMCAQSVSAAPAGDTGALFNAAGEEIEGTDFGIANVSCEIARAFCNALSSNCRTC